MNCRACGSGSLDPILELGPLYVSDFREDDSRSPQYPLDLLLCTDCLLVQLSKTTPRELLYTERYGYKSGISGAVRSDLASIVARVLFQEPPRGRWLDIACNDGTLLAAVPKQFERFGVEPVEKYAREARQHGRIASGYWPTKGLEGHFQVITSISVFYDVDDLNDFVAATAEALAPDGLWAIQQNYVLDMVHTAALDNICHEHVTYFSLWALEALLDAHGLEVVSVWQSDVNGGSLGTLVAHQGQRVPDHSVERFRWAEHGARVEDAETYARFARRALEHAHYLGGFARVMQDAGKSLYLCGASTRSQTKVSR